MSAEDTKDGSSEELTRILTIEFVIKKIHNLFHHKQADELLTQVMNWRLKTDVNLLAILLNLGHERVAT